MAEQELPLGPTLWGLLPLVREIGAFRQLLAAARAGGESAPGSGAPDVRHTDISVPSAIVPALLAALRQEVVLPARAGAGASARHHGTPAFLVVTPQAEQAKRLREEIALWSPQPASVLLYPDPDAMPYERIPSDPATVQQRLAVLSQLREAQGPHETAAGGLIVVASVRALLHPTLQPSELSAGSRALQRGMRVDLSGLLRDWLDLGYQPATVVEEPGQFSRRGGIVDVFPPSSEYPVRAELFDDEIDSLRYFDPVTQRSLGPARRVAVAPPTEVLPRQSAVATEALAAMDISSLRSEAQDSWAADMERLRTGQVGRGLEFYAPYFSTEPASLLDHLNGPVFLDSPDLLAETAGDLHAQAEELKSQLVGRGDLPAAFRRPYFTWDKTMDRLSQRSVVSLEPHAGEPPSDRPEVTVPRVYAGRLKQMLDDCQEWARQGRRVVLASHQARRLSALLAERNVVSVPLDGILEAPPPGSITIMQGSSSEGWVAGSLTLLSDAEIFGWVRPRRGTRKARPGRDAFLSELKPGDYVVHIEHGVGVFRGLTKMSMEGMEREYLHLDYAAGDRLFVPVDHIDRVSRYIGAGEGHPGLTRLSSADWEHAKSRVKAAVQNIAKELLALYAARETALGYAFSPDTVWQHDLESSFPYLETPDQLAAIEDVKSDMERQRPMDRLVCGDVGYGKTEVALRAAFKAVMDGKQAGILVPTTILAQQHFNTFRERLATYPVRLEMLSRFRSEKEQQRTLAGLRDGTVDVVIGTHRLLQKDVAFKDLGLVIIDEEQRFGVAHKERLKQLRREVDVLTLTATPIPRTLHMSLAGVRDMSTIETPPEDRLPIVTIIHEYDDTLVREAILRERDRGGQVFFVHNRVHGIETVTTRLQKLVPEASFVVAHGQMQEDDLERVMLDFAEGRHDVLVCTAIIEAGLDIPNANTILINRANHFGLAQLYQLRGRVGRGANRAYAYFLYAREFQLSETAKKRLDVINKTTDLGAGFRVAMKDLEIRGAGNLLGAEQHGHIEAVGFDLYTRLLAQAVAELKELGGDSEPEEHAAIQVASMQGPTLELPLDAFLPADYVAGEAERLALYQRLATARSLAEVDELAADLRDRFGKLPPAAPSRWSWHLLFPEQLLEQAAAWWRLRIALLGVQAQQLLLGAPVLGPDLQGLAKNAQGPALEPSSLVNKPQLEVGICVLWLLLHHQLQQVFGPSQPVGVLGEAAGQVQSSALLGLAGEQRDGGLQELNGVPVLGLRHLLLGPERVLGSHVHPVAAVPRGRGDRGPGGHCPAGDGSLAVERGRVVAAGHGAAQDLVGLAQTDEDGLNVAQVGEGGVVVGVGWNRRASRSRRP